ncbi:MAG TPA: molybdopterin-dependent oxidoreductase [Candidatus Limnocylindrales bacterium]|nr:molybdopterin-dependent oxidoreductase [Candidatus Limnocylindrales bacterium]
MTDRPLPRPVTGLAGLAGVAAAALGIAVAEAIGGVLAGATSIVDAIGQVVIDLQPPGALEFVVQLFGTNDKLALQVVVLIAALALGGLFGALAARRFAVGAIGFGAFGVLGFIAGVAQPLASAPIVAVQAAAATGVAIQTLSWLLGRLQAPAGEPAIPSPARRSFLLRTGAVGIGAFALGAFGRTALESGRTAPAPLVPMPRPSETVPPLAAGSDLAPSTPGLTPIVIPNDDFYRIDTALLVPSLDTATWRLRIHGLVERETTLSWEQLTAMPQFEQYCTIACVSNEVGGHLVGNAKWTGIRLRDVLDLAVPTAQATQLVGRSVDDWTAGMPMSWVMDPEREPMIAVQMNDEPLPRAHGYPARLIVPGLFGYVSATKWLWELELTTESYDGYWVPLGWSKEGPILTQSRIDTPRGPIGAGQVPIAGVAWAPDRGIAKVEVGIDDTWQDADLSTPISDATWVQWVLPWDATPGVHTITVRATDGTGALQEQIPSRPAPDGARGWHTITVPVA